MAKLVSKTYAGALFEVALEQDEIDQILAEYTFVVESFQQNPDFFRILTSPKISHGEKQSILETTYQTSIGNSLMNFFRVLNDKKRTNAILDIYHGFQERVNSHKGNMIAEVQSVIPLDKDAIQSLEEKLNKVTGKTVTVNNVINPEIMGGLIVQVGDKIIDGSIKRKLEHMKHDLAQIII
jgi:F-type H+-transporting ATPase subunit delta